MKTRSGRVKMALGAAFMMAFGLAGLADGTRKAEELATTPVSRLHEDWWKRRHVAKLKAPERGKAKIVFIGDSITHAWETKGRAIWEKHYAPRGALDLGYGADRTEHVLWRLQNGEVEGLNPEVVVLMIGTNNTGHRQDPPDAIAAGVSRICGELRKRLPAARVLVLGIFPRGARPDDPLRVNNDRANEMLAKLADGQNIFFADLGKAFLAADGTLSKEIMPDLLHPNARGYQIWADAMAPHLDKLLKKQER